MNRLELVNSLFELADISNTPLATTVSQTGVNLRAVNWIKQAWIDIQNADKRWNFMLKDLSFVTSSSQSYTLTAMGCGSADTHPLKTLDRESLRIYTTATGVGDEQFLDWMDWDDFKDVYLFGARQSGRPSCFSQDPATKSVYFNSSPGPGYTVVGKYWRTAVSLATDADEPACPPDFHMAVVYRAVSKYAGFKSAAEAKMEAIENYTMLMAGLREDQTAVMGMAGPLA